MPPPLADRRLALLVFLILCLGSIPGRARAQSGIQITPDGRRVLVNKDVGGERWAITRNVADGTVTGNVFSAAGGDPLFVACEPAGEGADPIRLRCDGAQRCPLSPCDPSDWAFVAEVEVPASFFGAADGAAATAGVGEAMASRIAAARPAGGDAAAPAGVQRTPSGVGTLVNKDVGGGQRWAITLNGEDGTVTGNVFFPDGSEPAFVWCGRTGVDGEQFQYDCWGSNRCAASGCAGSDWSPLFPVAIDQAFFAAPDQVTVEELDAALFGSLGATGSFDAMIRAFAKGYSFRQIAQGGLAGRIQPPGDILDGQGAVVHPEDPPASPASSASLGRAKTVAVDPDALRRGLAQQKIVERQFTAIFLFLLNRGYSAQQIETAIEEKRLFLNDEGNVGGVSYDSAYIGDENGRPLDPSPIRGFDVLLPPSAGAQLCGNDRIEPGESCEPGLGFDQTCQSFGFESGSLTCASGVCRFDTRDCRLCGNDVATADEACDGNDIQGQTCRDLGIDVDGVPGCTSDCVLDPRPCERAVADGCPDGNLDPGEDCDGLAFRVRTCAYLDPQFDRGKLRCDVLTCRYDTSHCLRAEEDGCGDGNLDGGEQCDGAVLRHASCAEYDSSFVSGSLACLETCTYDTSDCEREPPGVCGDGKLDPGEACDGALLRQSDCAEIDPELSGTPGCNQGTCTYDLSACGGCGNGILEDDENCEPGILGGFTCAILGFGPGTLACDESCDFDTSGCGPALPTCGDGVREGDEQCDGGDLDGQTCESLGFGAGPGLGCTAGCRFQTDGCALPSVCGNALLEVGETCDGSDLDGRDCRDFGFGPGGDLGCVGDCKSFDTSGCVEDTPPTVTGVAPNPLVLTTGGSGLFTIYFTDPNADVVSGCIAGGDGFTAGCADVDTGGATSGSIGGTLFCGSVAQTFPFVAYVVDSQGHQSASVAAQLVCE